MVRLVGPQDIPYADIRVTRRAIQPPVDRSAAELANLSEKTTEILNHARDQQIENEVGEAEASTRRELDELRLRIENEPLETGPDGKPVVGPDGRQLSYTDRWQGEADAIMARNAAGLSAPNARQLWTERTRGVLNEERAEVLQLGQRRMLADARAGLITAVAKDQELLIDDNATERARTGALQRIDAMIASAVDRRMLGADEGARMAAVAHEAAAQFERSQGMRATAQAHEERIIAESNNDYATAMELARDIDEPLMRDMVTDRLNARFDQIDRARGEEQRNAMTAAITQIENGVLINDLPESLKRTLIQNQQWDDVRDYANNRRIAMNNGGVLASESEAYADELIGSGTSTPDSTREFATRTDIEWARMNPDDQARVRHAQAFLRGEEPATPGGQTLIESGNRDTLAYATNFAIAQGFNIGYAGGTQGSAATALANRRRAQFEGFIYGAVRRFVQENNRAPQSQAEMEEIARLATLRVSGGGRTEFVFQTGQEEGRQVRVAMANIPQWEATRLTRYWQVQVNGGRQPSPDQYAALAVWIEQRYAIELAQGGR
jgi:hypothetical protein